LKREINNKNDTISTLASQIEEIKQSHLNKSEIVEYLQKSYKKFKQILPNAANAALN
jgi:hypothetical protein